MKKKALVLAVCMALAAPTISAAKTLPNNLVGISLGEIEAKSFLNEPFKGIIPILLTDVQASKKLKIRLAHKAVFERMGTERLPILDNLRFQVIVLNDKPAISITSTRPIQMPFLNFVLEISGYHGNVYQDYTTLLDPKNYKEALFTKSENSEILTSKRKLTPQDNLFIDSSSLIILNDQREHAVKSGDTLSEIAQALNTAEISLKKMVKAIHQKNPKAFINNNINRLKAGSILSIPTSNELNNFNAIAKAAIEKKQSKSANNTKIDGMPKDAYRVKRGDTLSNITQKLGHKGISFTKMMVAIHTANPHAFSKNKINLLKAGKILRIPSLGEVSQGKQSVIATVNQPSVSHDPNLIILDYSNDPKSTEQTKEFKLDGFIVEKGDTLAKITKKIGHKDVPFSEMMKAIYVTNPDAFEKNNITMLVEGAIIRLPTRSEIKEMGNKKQESKPNPAILDEVEGSSLSNNGEAVVLKNLEKRVRELKRDLGKANSNLVDLESTLTGKETLLKEQSQSLLKLASTLKSLEESGKAIPTDVKEKNDELLEALITEASNLEKEDASSEVKKEASSSIDNELLAATRRGYIPDDVGQQLTNTFKEQLAEYSQYMSGKELLSSILALLFGLLLIRYRREIYDYTYTKISFEHPTYYPPFEEGAAREALKEKTINYQDTLVDLYDTQDDIDDSKKESNFSNEHLQECEELVDELVDDLGINTNIQSNNIEWDNLEKACDDYIAEYKDQSAEKMTETDNNIEDENIKRDSEEMTFELFEALAEGVISKDSKTAVTQEDKMMYAFDDDQASSLRLESLNQKS